MANKKLSNAQTTALEYLYNVESKQFPQAWNGSDVKPYEKLAEYGYATVELLTGKRGDLRHEYTLTDSGMQLAEKLFSTPNSTTSEPIADAKFQWHDGYKLEVWGNGTTLDTCDTLMWIAQAAGEQDWVFEQAHKFEIWRIIRNVDNEVIAQSEQKIMTVREKYNALYRAQRIANNPNSSIELRSEATATFKMVIKGNWSMRLMDAARTSYVQAKHIHFTGWLNSGSRHLQSRRKIQFDYLQRKHWLARMK